MKCAAIRYLLWVLVLALQACTPGKPADHYAQKQQAQQDSAKLVKVPGKRPLQLRAERPYNLETPLHYFLTDITPNDVFFVRWHLPLPPAPVSEDTFRLRIGGNVGRPLALSMNDLRTKFRQHKLIALCACAGNARSRFRPGVPGVQWVNGAMGNAEWTGVKVKDILAMAAPRSNSKFVSFNGLDVPVLPTTPDFIKSLELAHAMDGEVMIAYEMNGEPIPFLNGYPLKLIVPGWYGTYWVGMLNEIVVSVDSFKGYWMEKSYRVPKGEADGNEQPGSLAKETIPISKLDVRSIFVYPEPGFKMKKGKTYEIQGLAMDGGEGIAKVEISTDKGWTWLPAKLDPLLGKYSWTRWRYALTPAAEGPVELMVKATTTTGATQPRHHWNRSGYMRNEIESLSLTVVK